MSTASITVVCGCLLLIGILFWPTLYRYEKMTAGQSSFPVRVHRLTGYTEYFYGGEWVPERGRKSSSKGARLPADEKEKVTGSARFSNGIFSGELYNGGSWIVTAATFRVIAKAHDGSARWDRSFRTGVRIEPMSTSFFFFMTGDNEGSLQLSGKSRMWRVAKIKKHYIEIRSYHFRLTTRPVGSLMI